MTIYIKFTGEAIKVREKSLQECEVALDIHRVMRGLTATLLDGTKIDVYSDSIAYIVYAN